MISIAPVINPQNRKKWKFGGLTCYDDLSKASTPSNPFYESTKLSSPQSVNHSTGMFERMPVQKHSKPLNHHSS